MIERARPASDKEVRKFGITFSILAAVIAAYTYVVKGLTWWEWLVPVSLAFLLSGLAAPSVLRPIRKWWMLFAEALGWVMTRVLLTFFFYLVVTPIGLIMRLFGKDPMDRMFDHSAQTYWKKSERSGFDPRTMERQF